MNEEEIKIDLAEVNKAVDGLQSSSQGFTSSLASDFASGNELDAVKKINELNQALQDAADQYKALLLKNIQATKESVQSMKDTDDELASTFK
ncbi:YwqI/YxiC family protein [Metabacillus sp. KIGAM252]|uniref:YwqI/YxiC family protein n=1 Tax=Metabacillus flavus TaxID=2823519 RepID=A0ABS5LJM6_9BACI|nr:YwqI/YxiC family protein [Metabacillus flavus]MBS2970763.1 YwqI/YxiC family protein [Metabacillus flavus]